MRLEDKIAEMQSLKKSMLESDIFELERMINYQVGEWCDLGLMVIEHLGKSKEELMEIKRQKEIELNDKPANTLHKEGWQFFDDVCYLSAKEMRDFEVSYKKHLGWCDKQSLFDGVNYLKYLIPKIAHFEKMQDRYKRIRCEAPPAKELIKVLEYIGGDHELNEPLIGLLASFGGDHSGDIVSYYQRMAYKLKMGTVAKLDPPKLNIDTLTGLNKEYKQKIKDLYSLVRKYSPKNYKPPTADLLLDLNLPPKIDSIESKRRKKKKHKPAN